MNVVLLRRIFVEFSDIDCLKILRQSMCCLIHSPLVLMSEISTQQYYFLKTLADYPVTCYSHS